MKKLSLFFVMLFLVVGTLLAQRTISGTITDSGGDALIGANVLVKGTTVGTITDVDGKYMLSVPSDESVLIISYTGYEAQEISVGAASVLDFILSEGILLDQAVITALGIKREDKALGYSLQSVDGGVLSEAPELNVVNSLGGRVAGIHITNSSGAVGSSSRIILRGISSIYGDNQPLFIVDGVAISNANTGTSEGSGGFDLPNGVADINPSDIESVNVLKGASAAALYGGRASNGVVEITTKKGTKSKALGVEISSGITFERPLVTPDYQNSYGQGSDDKTFEYINGNDGDGGVDESWGPPLDVGLNFMQFESFINNPDNPQPEPWVSHPNNVRDFYETGITSTNNIAFSGGTDNASFRLGLGYTDQAGIIPFTDFSKISVNGGGSYDLSSKLSAELSVNFVKSASDNLPSAGYDGANVVQQTIWAGRQVDFTLLEDWRNLPKALPGSTYGAGLVPINWNTQFQNNPYWQLENNTNSFNRNRLIGNFGLKYNFTDWLSLNAQGGVDFYTTKTSAKFAKGSAGDAPTYWRYLGNRDGQSGFYDEDHRSYFSTQQKLFLTADKQVSNSIGLNVVLGTGAGKLERTFDYRGIQLELPGLYNLANLKSGTTLFNKNEHHQGARFGVFGSAEVAYDNWLYLTVTGRNDWTSVLPVANNSFFYPSVGLSAVLTDAFDIPASWLDYLKVRAGWAQVGGAGPLAHGDIIAVYEQSSLPWNGNVFGNFPAILNNPNLKSQTTTGYEGGFDAKMFSNRVRLSATYYDQLSFDLILPVEVTRSSGVSSVWDNVGELRNKGVELQLGLTVIDKRDLAVDLDFNWAKNNNQVIKAGKDDENDEETIILGGTWNMDLEVREGEAYGSIVGASLGRVEDESSEFFGEVIYENGLPTIGDQKVLGNIQPDWTGGVNLGVMYKGLTFSTLVDAKIGGDVYSMTSAWGRFAGILSETLEGRETGIVGNGVMLDGEGNYVANNVVVSAETYNHNTYGNDIVETSVFDASYVKLRQVALGYDIPVAWGSGIGIQKINLSVIGRNLAILYKKAPHIDPETGFSSASATQGQEFGQLPSTRSIGASLKLNF